MQYTLRLAIDERESSRLRLRQIHFHHTAYSAEIGRCCMTEDTGQEKGVCILLLRSAISIQSMFASGKGSPAVAALESTCN